MKFRYAQEVPNVFDGGKTMCIRYHLEVGGIPKIWDRTSRVLAEKMAEVALDSFIIIRRDGEKSKTRYTITKVEE